MNPERRIKICHIITGLGTGGAERLVINMASCFQDDQWDIIICSLLKPSNEIKLKIEKSGLKLVPFHMWSKIDLTFLIRLIVYLRGKHIMILHAHLIHASIIGRIAARLAGVPVIISTEHNTSNWKMKSGLMNKLNVFTSRWNNKIIAISQEVQKAASRPNGYKADKMTVIYNGIIFPPRSNNNLRKELMDKYGISANDIIVIAVSRLDRRKGIQYLIEAVSLILKKTKNVYCIIIGHGSELPNLIEIVSRLKLQNHVLFTGEKQEVDGYLEAADIFVQPSLDEGLGISIIEAMAHKKPVIATYIGGIPEVVEHEVTGLLVPPRSPKDIADAFYEMYYDKEKMKAMGEKGYEKVRVCFTLQSMVDKVKQLYLQELNNIKYN